eukprot:gene2874-1111_t
MRKKQRNSPPASKNKNAAKNSTNEVKKAKEKVDSESSKFEGNAANSSTKNKDFFIQLESNHVSKKFGRRTIESNWAKYDIDNNHEDGSSQTEEDQRTVGKHFETLVSQAGRDVSTFKFKDENDIVSVHTSDNATEVDGPLHFDLEVTGSSLREIPVYQKLGIQETLSIISEPGVDWHGDYLEYIKETVKTCGNRNIELEENTESSWVWKFDEMRGYETKVKKLLERISMDDDIENEPLECETVKRKEANENRVQELKDGIGKLSVYESVNNKTEIQQNSAYQKDEEDELEALLSISSGKSEDETKFGSFNVKECKFFYISTSDTI